MRMGFLQERRRKPDAPARISERLAQIGALALVNTSSLVGNIFPMQPRLLITLMLFDQGPAMLISASSALFFLWFTLLSALVSSFCPAPTPIPTIPPSPALMPFFLNMKILLLNHLINWVISFQLYVLCMCSILFCLEFIGQVVILFPCGCFS